MKISGQAFLFVLVACTCVRVQSGTANGSIRGEVKDTSGAAVPRAAVEARNAKTGYERKSITDDLGGFELPLLPVGSYEVQVKAPGFAAYSQRGIVVELARASDLTVRLAVTTEQQSITVEADASILNTSSASVDGGLNQKSMENMPVTSRNSFNMALLASGRQRIRQSDVRVRRNAAPRLPDRWN